MKTFKSKGRRPELVRKCSSRFLSVQTTVDGFTEQLRRVVTLTFLRQFKVVYSVKWSGCRSKPSPRRERLRLERRWLSFRTDSDRQLYRRACQLSDQRFSQKSFSSEITELSRRYTEGLGVVKELPLSSSSDNSRPVAENRELCHSFSHFFTPKFSVKSSINSQLSRFLYLLYSQILHSLAPPSILSSTYYSSCSSWNSQLISLEIFFFISQILSFSFCSSYLANLSVPVNLPLFSNLPPSLVSSKS